MVVGASAPHLRLVGGTDVHGAGHGGSAPQDRQARERLLCFLLRQLMAAPAGQRRGGVWQDGAGLVRDAHAQLLGGIIVSAGSIQLSAELSPR